MQRKSIFTLLYISPLMIASWPLTWTFSFCMRRVSSCLEKTQQFIPYLRLDVHSHISTSDGHRETRGSTNLLKDERTWSAMLLWTYCILTSTSFRVCSSHRSIKQWEIMDLICSGLVHRCAFNNTPSTVPVSTCNLVGLLHFHCLVWASP